MNRLSRRATRPLTVLAVSGALVLTACGGSEDPDAAAPSASPSPSSTVAVPDGVEISEQGLDLALGESATVTYEADQNRGTVLELTVEKIRLGRIEDLSGLILNERDEASTPYYVDATVTNAGEEDLGGASVPLWAVDAENTLVQVSVAPSLDVCPSAPLPESFGPGESTEACLLYLIPDGGELTGVSFRPNQEFDPILWTGEIVEPAKRQKKGRNRDN